MLAAAYGHAGQVQAALSALNEALVVADKTGEHYYEAELHRLKGELMLQHARTHASASRREAEACFQKAIAVATRQRSKSLELRATLSLAQLWQAQGETAEARQRLDKIYGAFTEGFDSADLRAARALLDELPLKP